VVNVVVVGDSGVGKTNLILSYAADEFPTVYKPTVFDNYSSEIEYNGHPTNLEIWDLSGKDEHQSLRKFAYSKAQAIIICFSINDIKSFKSIQSKWLREIRADEKLKSLPLILAATKCDMFEE
jgi:small GTP-binding protein